MKNTTDSAQEERRSRFISFFVKVWEWYKKRYIHLNMDCNVTKLKWMKKDLGVNKPFEWGFADSVEFDIEAIKTKREVIIDMQIPEKQVEQECVARI